MENIWDRCGGCVCRQSHGQSVRRESLAPTARPVETVKVATGPTGPLLECSQRARDTVLNASAVSTRKLNSCKWKVFCDWCSSRDINPLQCSVGCILDFLQHLLELGRSAPTLKVYVAALSAHRSEFGASSLGSDQPIVAFLKGANRLCSPQAVRSPTWDLSMVFSSLCQPPFEPILESDIKWLSFKTAFLLAITTAKHASELDALSVSAPCLCWSADFSSVSLWPNPVFLPKILSPHFMNTPIVLAALPYGWCYVQLGPRGLTSIRQQPGIKRTNCLFVLVICAEVLLFLNRDWHTG